MAENEPVKQTGKIANQEGRKPPMKWLKIEYVRLLGQFVMVLLINFTVVGSVYVAPFLPILRLDIPMGEIPYIYEHGMIRACPMATFQRTLTDTWEFTLLFFAAAIFLIVVLMLGRSLCGWACPFGLVQDVFTRVRSILGIPAKEFSQGAHENLTLIRFAILGLFILLSISIGISALGDTTAGNVYQSYLPEGIFQTAPYCAICPTPSMYYIMTVVTFQAPLGLDDPVHIIMWIMMAVFAVGSFIQPRFFCRYLCPTGAMSSPFNKISMVHIHKDPWGCTKCHVCYTNCPMRVREVLDEDKKERLGDVDCIMCGECIQRCPERVLTIRFGPITIYRGGTRWEDRLAFRKPKGKT